MVIQKNSDKEKQRNQNENLKNVKSTSLIKSKKLIFFLCVTELVFRIKLGASHIVPSVPTVVFFNKDIQV